MIVRLLSIPRIKAGRSVHLRSPLGASDARNARELRDDNFGALRHHGVRHSSYWRCDEIPGRPARPTASSALDQVTRRGTCGYLGQER